MKNTGSLIVQSEKGCICAMLFALVCKICYCITMRSCAVSLWCIRRAGRAIINTHTHKPVTHTHTHEQGNVNVGDTGSKAAKAG
jgi:hypothetical protein